MGPFCDGAERLGVELHSLLQLEHACVSSRGAQSTELVWILDFKQILLFIIILLTSDGTVVKRSKKSSQSSCLDTSKKSVHPGTWVFKPT